MPPSRDDPLGHVQPIQLQPSNPRRVYRTQQRQRQQIGCFLLAVLIPLLCCSLTLLPYFIFPGRTNILLLGLDSRDEEGDSTLGRTDTMILTTFVPSQPYMGMLSIPRDLWVALPGSALPTGEQNRINTAHFFAEANQPGSGPGAAMQVVHDNFGVDVQYYARIRFEGVRHVIDAMGGIEVALPEAMAGFEAGTHHFDGKDALKFARERYTSDDLARGQRSQIVMKAMIRQLANPLTWFRFQEIWLHVSRSIDTDIPGWMWPRLMLTLLRLGPEGLDGHYFSHEMVTPFETDGGAQVLLPNWDQINPVLLEVFGQ
jgi:polyisoprenyl-teichoic acid--peptidoglycan teichoic acid transferase